MKDSQGLLVNGPSILKLRRFISIAACLGFVPCSASAEQSIVTGTPSLSNAARLDFRLNISKYLYFGLGTFTYPSANTTVDSVIFQGSVIIPGPSGSSAPNNGSNVGIPWNGGAPIMQASSTTLNARVRSNAGQVSINVTVVNPLTRVPAATIPFSRLTVTASNTAPPSPALPNPGTTAGSVGTAVNVPQTGAGSRVTDLSGSWTFNYNFAGLSPPGTYNGRLRYTASTL